MRDETFASESRVSQPDSVEPAGALQRALYLWERQPPLETRSVAMDPSPLRTGPSQQTKIESNDPSESVAMATPPIGDLAIEGSLKHHASRLAALERIIPGDRRLDSPRFSLMMLNAFLGRAVTEGAVLARLPGLHSISDRIDTELTDLELEYPAALEKIGSEPDPTPVLLRDEMRALFDELKSTQKAQQRQLVSSLSALHAAISELRSHLPDRQPVRESLPTGSVSPASPHPDDLARPLIDSERLLDPRPVLAAARAAASRAKDEIEAIPSSVHHEKTNTTADQRPYRSILLGSAFLGIMMILFGRDAVQFLSTSPLHPAVAQP